jgi:transposase
VLFRSICSQQFKLGDIQSRVEQLKCAHESGQCVHCADKDKTIEEQGETIKALRAKIYGRSSERRTRRKKGGGGDNKAKSKTRCRLPSEQYPNAKIKVETIVETSPPKCSECHEEMTDSGMRETSERLEIIPMEIFIVQMERIRYHCKCCQSAPVTAALPARIAPNTSLNDSVLIEAAIAKFYDLIPTERYAKMLSRSGVEISDKLLFLAQTYLAKAYDSVYLMLKQEILTSRVVHADESPHRMLENNEGKSLWYLWSFCTRTSVYFEIHNTRAGSVSIEFLKDSQAQVLLSDVYSGYIRTIREVNEYRQSKGIDMLASAHCNDHARRYFFYAKEHALADQVLDVYEKIYATEARVQAMIERPIYAEPENSQQALGLRQTMDPLFEQIYDLSCEILLGNTPTSSMGQAANYFLKNLPGLTKFLTDLGIPISNAPAERSIRNPAVGRKTWYGTHSRKGAETAAVHFSLFESCRLNQVNPREYYNHLADLHNAGKPLITPLQYKQKTIAKPPPGS